MNLYYDGKSFKLNAETKYSESQIWLRLSNGASIEITHEQDGIPEEDYFFSFRLHCSNEEKDKYKETCGVITTSCFDELWEVQECLRFTLEVLKSAGVVLDLTETVWYTINIRRIIKCLFIMAAEWLYNILKLE